MSKNRLPKVSKNDITEGNLYDKIFKENAESVFLPLIEKRLDIKIKKFQPLKEKLQTTLEREMDFFYEVETETTDKFLLHIEFQTEDDFDMVYRSGEYHGIALRLKKMEIRHLVIYLGTKTPKMRTTLNEKEIYKGFELINIHALNTVELLSSQVPDIIILAILSDYDLQQSESILRLIFKQLKAVCQNKKELSKYINQLIVLSRLRKIDNLTIKISQEMPITYDIQKDYLYNKGIEKGIEKGLEIPIINAFKKGHKAEQIALFLDLPLEKVKGIINKYLKSK